MAYNAGVVVVVREKNADLQEGRKSDKREMTDTRYRFFEGLEFGDQPRQCGRATGCSSRN